MRNATVFLNECGSNTQLINFRLKEKCSWCFYCSQKLKWVKSHHEQNTQLQVKSCIIKKSVQVLSTNCTLSGKHKTSYFAELSLFLLYFNACSVYITLLYCFCTITLIRKLHLVLYMLLGGSIYKNAPYFMSSLHFVCKIFISNSNSCQINVVEYKKYICFWNVEK